MATEMKQEYLAEKASIDEKHDIEAQSVVLEEEENSPIPEVAAVVSNKDDPSMPTLTWFRAEPLSISPLVIQLIAYPIGKFMARVLPKGFMNPGPFNIKEHVLVGLTANCAGGTAYAVDIVVIQKAFYHQDFGFLANFLIILTTQMLGYGMAGVLRRYLVYPSAMVWPATLVQVALFNTLHAEENLAPGQWTRYKVFMVVAIGMFFYQWLPGFLFPVMSAVTWLCWINPKSRLLATLGGSENLGIGAFTLNWNTIVSYLASPLVVPWWAQVNIGVGFFLIAYVMTPVAYFTNLWNTQQYPIITAGMYKNDGQKYEVDEILTNFQLDEVKYKAYGPLRITTFFVLTYGIGFAGLASMVSHTWLYHRHKLVEQWKQSREHSEDIHHRMMQNYPEVPDWWYFSIFIIMTVLAIVSCEVWDYKLPWWGVLLSIALSCFFVLPVGLIQALTNQQPGLNIITEYVIGYMLPGRPVANVVFKTMGYISMAQALTFVSDLKLGHYMKIPPRSMFWSQCLGTFIAGLVNLITANWMFSSNEGVCTTSETLTCPHARTFFSASVIWGVIAPNRMFGPSSIYNPINYFFIFGFLVPIPVYFIKKKFSNTWVDYIHVPIILASTGMMPPAKPMNYTNWLAVGFIFQYYLRRYHNRFHLRYTYVLSAAFDSGVAIMLFVMFLIFELRGATMAPWWGTKSEALCPLNGQPYRPAPSDDPAPAPGGH
ncbi:hypothetical protein BGZ83_008492 [Gryganskiella cystojenkinii]|nr:hypothetical protein BGZ83_008492 [Gryganskiella cystojenkinii]